MSTHDAIVEQFSVYMEAQEKFEQKGVKSFRCYKARKSFNNYD